MNIAFDPSRRQFLRTAFGLAAGAGLLGASALNAAPDPARKKKKAGGKKAGKAAKKWACGCRDVHLKFAGQADAFAAMQALGAQGIELNLGFDMGLPDFVKPGGGKYDLGTADGVKVLRDDLAAHGVVATALLMSNQFDVRLDQEIVWMGKAIQAAQGLGVNTIRIDVVARKMEKDAFLPFSIATCKKIVEISEGTGLRFGIENHGKITNDPAFLDQLFDGVGSDRIGLTLDCANFYWWGHPLESLYGIYEKFATRAFHTHCKSIGYPEDKRNAPREMGWEYGKYCCPITEGDIDYQRVVAILKKANYQGDLCIEDESLGRLPKDQQAEALRKEIAFLKTLV